MGRLRQQITALVAATGGLLAPLRGRAQFTLPTDVARQARLPTTDLPLLIAQVVRTALLLVAVLALAVIVYGGFKYITSQGDTDQVETAKRTITYAVIGIVAIGLAYALVEFVIRAVLTGR